MNDPSGSRWRKWDLHFHTPRSYDHGRKSLTASEVVDRLTDVGIEAVAITDHHVIDFDFIKEMQHIAGSNLTVLAGVEFACPLGGKEGVHFIGIFSEDANFEYLSNELLSRSGVCTQRNSGKSDEQIYVNFEETAKAIHDLGGLVSVHAHGKSNSIEGIANNSALKQEFKKDILRDLVDILEIGNEERIEDYQKIVFPAIGFTRPLVIGSDDHARDDYPVDRCCWIKADPTFSGLKMALREPKNRICLNPTPPSVIRLNSNKTKYIKSIEFDKLPSMPKKEKWLQGKILLNPGLVAVIGNKGSGKSALTDCIGLLGSSANSDAFSFLELARFRHPKTGRAQHIEAIIDWHAGEPRRRRLDEQIAPDEPERVKYLPQNFVEKVCNDLTSPDDGDFESELKKVVYSKVTHADRLGRHTLDELLEFRTKELQQEAIGLINELRDLGGQRAILEARLDPVIKTGVEKKIKRKEEEIQSHEATKPLDREAPPEDPSDDEKIAKFIAELEKLKEQREAIVERLQEKEVTVTEQQLRAATAQKLLDKLENIEKLVVRAVEDLSAEAEALGIDYNGLVTLVIDKNKVTVIREDAIKKRDITRETIESSDAKSPGLKEQRDLLEQQIKSIQEQLSRPHQEYQKYLEAKQEWESTRLKLLGNKEDPGSLNGLKASLNQLDTIPSKIELIRQKQKEIARMIHELRLREASVFSELYTPVQKFIAEHPLASDHLKLEFKVELVEDRFVDDLLNFLNQNRAGSFYGVEEGRKVAKKLASTVEWSDWKSVCDFLKEVDDHLHNDKRPEKKHGVVQLADQIIKGRKVAELYQWLYSLSYIKPRYLLRWDGKEVGQLSPGERGTLLLIFYLLVDDSELPLIIDQPEANLDNETVAKKLVHCIQAARKRRQLILVTHNPNLAVFCDADQIIHATMDIVDGNRISYESGALEHPSMNRFTLNVLEGGRDPFDMRDTTYRVVGA